MDREQTEKIRQRYNRTALWYDTMDRMLSPELRQEALVQARGKVLEVGVGTGQNLKFYPPGVEVVGIDFSSAMLKKAKRRADEAPVPVQLVEMDAQEMTFPDDEFDTVVATCVFCSVPDPVAGLREVKRVCKPDGSIILLEHVRAENPLLGKVMDWLNPLSLILVGSNINRRTVENIEKAGINIQKIDNVRTPIVKLISADPN